MPTALSFKNCPDEVGAWSSKNAIQAGISSYYSPMVESKKGLPPQRTSFRIWVIVGALALLGGSLLGSNFYGQWTSLTVFRWGDEPDVIPRLLWRGIPFVLSMIALGTLVHRSPKVRGAVLTIASFLALVSGLVENQISTTPSMAIQTWIEIIIGGGMVAAGNHVMKCIPGKRLPGIVAGLGGLRVFVSYFNPDGYYSVSLFFRIGACSASSRSALLFAWLLLVYAALGMLCPFMKSRELMRHRATSILGYVLLLLLPWVSYIEWDQVGGLREHYLGARHLKFVLAFWMLGTGYTVVLGSGIAIWLQAALKPSELNTVLPRQ
jgi:hypothetical protein